MLTVVSVNVEKEAGERIDSPASDAFSVLYPIPLDKQESAKEQLLRREKIFVE